MSTGVSLQVALLHSIALRLVLSFVSACACVCIRWHHTQLCGQPSHSRWCFFVVSSLSFFLVFYNTTTTTTSTAEDSFDESSNVTCVSVWLLHLFRSWVQQTSRPPTLPPIDVTIAWEVIIGLSHTHRKKERHDLSLLICLSLFGLTSSDHHSRMHIRPPISQHWKKRLTYLNSFVSVFVCGCATFI